MRRWEVSLIIFKDSVKPLTKDDCLKKKKKKTPQGVAGK